MEFAQTIRPSARGELEITELSRCYLKDGSLHGERFGRGSAWLDTGTAEGLLQAAQFVQTVQTRTGMLIGSPEEIAFRKGWINAAQLRSLADAIDPQVTPNFLINIDERQSLAVRAAKHVPVVFDDPERFGRKGLYQSRPLIDNNVQGQASSNASQRFLEEVAQSARQASVQVSAAWRNYQTPVDYGIFPMDLPKVASMIKAQLPTRIYHTAYRHNAFDTHVHQAEQHQRLLTYVSDGVSGFMQDLKRLGRDKDVLVVVYSEFGRRAAENTSLGTDHGTANHVYLVGPGVKGGHHGQAPSLTNLNAEGNVLHTTDFRRVYASVIEQWMGANSQALLNGRFDTLPVLA
ncbi:MAG: DUF1501 domain-containing protein [Betaproteobacteria bacterium]|nr:DUF1501 domain-containing protein [Betaproteobacteria bacterium]